MVRESWLKLDNLIPDSDEEDVPELTCNTKEYGRWRCCRIGPNSWLKNYRANMDRAKEKSFSVECMQSWWVIGAQPQKNASHTCEDGEKKWRLSS